MTKLHYSDMSNEQLANAFIELSLCQADAIGLGKQRRMRELFDELRALKEALRARGLEARKVLVPLLSYSPRSPSVFQDQAAQVRLNAARELLAVLPEQARATLEDLASRGPSAQSGRAGMCLQFLDDGVFKPT